MKSKQQQTLSRNPTIDILRGTAIFTMIAGNLAGPLIIQPFPFSFRFYYSFAAALFILLAGMMVALTTYIKNYDFKYFLIRGIAIIVIAILIDIVIYKAYPFTDCDVLYLIGFSLPLTYLFGKLNPKCRFGIIIIIFAVTPILQHVLGYPHNAYTVYFNQQSLLQVLRNGKTILLNWIVKGAFPIFPWIGFSFLGQFLYAIYEKQKSPTRSDNNWRLLIGVSILLLGAVIWWQYPGHLYIRRGYSELFYPPTVGYILTAVGLILILFSIVNLKPSLLIYKPLEVFGQSALFIYILHLAVITYIIQPIWPTVHFTTYLVIYFILTVCLMIISYLIKLLKSKLHMRSFVLKLLLGG
jgi:uncharacterized membrane protein